MGIRSKVFKQESFQFRRDLIEPPESLIRVRGKLFSRMNQKLNITEKEEIIIERYKRNLDLILMNLFLANRKGMLLRYGRSSNFFVRDKYGLENRKYIRYRISKEIFDFLESEGLIQQFIGFRRYGAHKKGRLTRVVINDSMKELLSKIEMYTVFKSDTRVYNPIVVRFKGEFNNNQDPGFGYILRKFWMRKEKIRELKKHLDQINTLYEKSKITVHIPTDILNDILTDKLDRLLNDNIPITHLTIKNKPNDIKDSINNTNKPYNYIYRRQYVVPGKSDVSYLNYCKKVMGVTQIDLEIRKKYIRRIFRENFKGNGRFHGPVYQQMNKKFREHILIDGEETIEIDYDAMHFRMLYHVIGVDYMDDPFAMPSKESRFFVKKAGYIMLNAKSRKAAILGVVHNYAKEGVYVTNVTAADILDRFCKRHPLISRFFYNSRWKALFCAESEIVYDILCELKKKGIIGLPIHDSIIVKKKHEDLLRSLMIEKYRDRFKFSPFIS